MIATKGSLHKISLYNNGTGTLGQATLMIGLDTGYSILSSGISFEKNKVVWSDGTQFIRLTVKEMKSRNTFNMV